MIKKTGGTHKARKKAPVSVKKAASRARVKSSARSKQTMKRDEASEDREKGFPIVGIGASAGGLEAFGQFFAEMPLDSGMAFILIPHLDPDAQEHHGRPAEALHEDAHRPGRGRHGRGDELRLYHPA